MKFSGDTQAGRRTIWIDADYERLFAEARATNDTAKRQADYARMMEIMHAQNPSLFLFGLPSLYGVNRKVTGFEASADKILRLSRVDLPQEAPGRIGGGRSMLSYVARRLLYVPLSLLLVTGAAFVVLRATGNPIDIFLDPAHTQAQADALTARLHLDRSILVQFGYYLVDILRGDFGQSPQFGGPAMPAVLERLGATLELMSVALAAALVLGVVGGTACAVWRDRLPDLLVSTLAIAAQSMPSFWLGIPLIQVLAVDLRWLPTSGRGGWPHLLLPAATLAAFVLPNFILITRASVLEVMGEQFVVTARAKGLSGRVLLWIHILPNALNPVLSFLGLQIGRLVAGSIVTETIFSWPGIGRLLIGSIFQRDVPVVLAGIIVVSLFIVAANLLVDILLSLADPRIRLA